MLSFKQANKILKNTIFLSHQDPPLPQLNALVMPVSRMLQEDTLKTTESPSLPTTLEELTPLAVLMLTQVEIP